MFTGQICLPRSVISKTRQYFGMKEDIFAGLNHEILAVTQDNVRDDGVDIQGLKWEGGTRGRDEYMARRRKALGKASRLSRLDLFPQEIPQEGGTYYEFQQFSRLSPPAHWTEIGPALTKQLIWSTSRHDLYYPSKKKIKHRTPYTPYPGGDEASVVLDLKTLIEPSEHHPGFAKPTVMTVKNRMLIVGGFHGELICKNIKRPGISYCKQLNPGTGTSPLVVNSIEIGTSSSGATHFIVSADDGLVRYFDMGTFQLHNKFEVPWKVKHTSLSPDGEVIIMVGEDQGSRLYDFRSRELIASMGGHADEVRASSWHPGGQTFATGGVDGICRIWDSRNLSVSVSALRAKASGIESVRYTSDGRFMAMGELFDFVRIFDVESGYRKEQVVDFQGYMTGMSFSPDTETLFVGVIQDVPYPSESSGSGVLQCWRCHDYSSGTYADTYADVIFRDWGV